MSKLLNVRDHLRQMADRMITLADQISDHSDTESLNLNEKELIKVAYLPHIGNCMAELKMFYLTGNKEEVKNVINYLHELMEEVI